MLGVAVRETIQVGYLEGEEEAEVVTQVLGIVGQQVQLFLGVVAVGSTRRQHRTVERPVQQEQRSYNRGCLSEA